MASLNKAYFNFNVVISQLNILHVKYGPDDGSFYQMLPQESYQKLHKVTSQPMQGNNSWIKAFVGHAERFSIRLLPTSLVPFWILSVGTSKGI